MSVSAAVKYEVRWRVTGTEQWSDLAPCSPVGEIVVEGLDRTKQYDFEVRAVSACGARSAWGSASNTVPIAPAGTLVLADIANEVTTAQASANAANAALADIASDNLLTPGEKPVVIRDDNVILAEQTGIDAQATAYGITTEKTAYDNAVTALTTYLATLTAPKLWSDLTGNTTIVGATFRSNFANVYTTRQALLDKIYAAAKSLADTAQATGNTAVANAAAAATAASNAQTAANTANAALADIASDNLLTPGEKPVVIRDDNVILAEQTGIDAQATAYGITTEKTAYDSAVTALTTYLATLTAPKLWSDLTGNTTIVGATFRSNFANVYTTRQTLLNAIYAAAKVRSDAAQSTANAANANVPAVINPQFANGLTGWTPGNATGWYVQTGGANLPDPIVNTAAVHAAGGGASATDAMLNAGHIPVVPGQQVTVTCCVREVGANAGALGYGRISWRDASNTEISTSGPTGGPQYPNCGIPGTGTYTQCVTKVIATAPAGAQYAAAETTVIGHTAGYFLFSNMCIVAQPSSIDEVPDGTTNSRTIAARVNGGKPVIDFSEGIHFNKQLDNIGDGSTYGRVRNAALQNNVPPPAGAGKNFVANPTFTLNTMGIAAGYSAASGQFLCDGWYVYSLSTGCLVTYENGTTPANGFHAYLSLRNFTAPNGGYAISFIAGMSFGCSPGAPYVASGTFYSSWTKNPPAGCTRNCRIAVDWHGADGALISGAYYDNTAVSGAQTVRQTFTAPAGAAYGVPNCGIYISNSSGAAYTDTIYPFDSRVSYVGVYGTQSMDDEVVDGSTYGRTVQARLSSGVPLIDFASGIHFNKNLDNIANGATYARTAGNLGTGSALTIENNTFQLPLDGAGAIPNWKPYSGGTLYYQTSTPAPGLGNQYMVIHGGSNQGAVSATKYMVTPGDQMSIKALVNAISGAQCQVGVVFSNAAGSFLGGYFYCFYSAASWGWVTTSGTVPAGAMYAEIYFQISGATVAYACINAVIVTVNDVRVAGSGAVLGNQLNAPNSLTLNLGAVRSTTALTATSAGAVTVNVFTYYMGSAAVSYAAVTNAVTGLSQGSTYYIYCHDAGGTGGTKSWLYTTNVNVLLQTYDDIVVAGQVTIPTSGSSGGGGSGACVCDDMFVDEGLYAGDALVGDVFDCLDLPTSGRSKFRRALQAMERTTVDCVRLETSLGGVWEGSASTPFDLPGGGVEWAPRMKGEAVVTDLGIETVTRVEFIGPRPVSHIHLGGCSYAAGIDPRHRIYSHNLQYKP